MSLGNLLEDALLHSRVAILHVVLQLVLVQVLLVAARYGTDVVAVAGVGSHVCAEVEI